MLIFNLLFFFQINFSLPQAVKNVLLVVFSWFILTIIILSLNTFVSFFQELFSNAFIFLCIKSEETRQGHSSSEFFYHLKVLRKLVSFCSSKFFHSKHRIIRIYLCQCVWDVMFLYSFLLISYIALKPFKTDFLGESFKYFKIFVHKKEKLSLKSFLKL